jgi:hypothetical protein
VQQNQAGGSNLVTNITNLGVAQIPPFIQVQCLLANRTDAILIKPLRKNLLSTSPGLSHLGMKTLLEIPRPVVVDGV